MRLVIATLLIGLTVSVAFGQEPVRTQPEPADDEVVVKGRIERPVPTPPGDPRSDAQRMRDIRAWDRCVIRAQSVAGGSDDPTRYQPLSPEEYCRERLGMADRLAVPLTQQ